MLLLLLDGDVFLNPGPLMLGVLNTRSVRNKGGGHGGRVETLLPPTSEAGVRSPAWPQMEKLV